MKIITDRTLKVNLKKAGFQEVDQRSHTLINDAFVTFTHKTIEKAHKVAQKDGKQAIEKQHVQRVFEGRQKGGAETTLPLEYFGVRSGHYHENAPMGADMSVTNSLIRPAFAVNDPAGVIQAGAGVKAHFVVPFNAVKQLCQKHEAQVREDAQKVIKQKFESHFSEVLAKVSKKYGTDELKGDYLESVLEQRKYQKLFKK